MRISGKSIGIVLACILAVVAGIVVGAHSGPCVSLFPGGISFVVEDGLDPSSQVLTVGGYGDVVSWSALADAPWLSLEPSHGTTDGEATISLSAEVRGMNPGEYSAFITVSAPQARRSTIQVPVNLVIIETRETLAIREAVGGDTENVEIYYDVQPPYSKGPDGTVINLVNCDAATDRTWQELLWFIVSDDTQADAYIEGLYMCGSFAERLHNNAEQAGIRAAVVAVHFEDRSESHALNAFYTVDKGLVFVDCTGGGVDVIHSSLHDGYDYAPDYSRIAYVRVGGDYGLVSLENAHLPSYSFYEEYTRQWQHHEELVQEYNTRVDKYTELLGGRTVIDDYSEYLELKAMYDDLEWERSRLEAVAEDLGDYRWFSLGIVSHIEIYW